MSHYVITSPCVGTCDTECVTVCPVDCIAGPVSVEAVRAIPKPERGVRLPGVQLFIDADQCICCGACQPVCPVAAILHVDDVPPGELPSIDAAAAFFASRG